MDALITVLLAVAAPVQFVVGWPFLKGALAALRRRTADMNTLVALGTLFAAIATRIGRGEALVATLLFPAATPLLISATRCSAAAIAGRPLSGVSNWILLTAGFDLLYIFAAFLLFEFVLEE